MDMKTVIKKAFRSFGFEITRYIPNPREDLVSLKPENGCLGIVLLSLLIEPFLLKEGEPLPNTHAHHWRSLQIAKTFLDMGYGIDAIDYRNNTFIPRKRYAFFIAFRTNFERIARRLNEDCIKIVHLDTAHWLFNNSSTFRRGLSLQQRKGVTLKGLRIVETNMAIESADYATISGSQFTINTYSYAKKPIFKIPYSACAVYPRPAVKNYEDCRRSYLWFGSKGFVHKGLDLVLDAFSEMPDYSLYICGPIQEEKDFEQTYYKELYQAPNIHTIGWVDISSQEFTEIINRCVGVVYPSCSEGQAGSVITCMHAGLIPIVSYESGIDINEKFGVVLQDSSSDTIREAVQMISSLPAEKLKQMSYSTWEYARANHTRERFADEYKKVITQILKTHKEMNKPV